LRTDRGISAQFCYTLNGLICSLVVVLLCFSVYNKYLLMCNIDPSYILYKTGPNQRFNALFQKFAKNVLLWKYVYRKRNTKSA
jgi:hypothetical protein